jgi:hypothetical protein
MFRSLFACAAIFAIGTAYAESDLSILAGNASSEYRIEIPFRHELASPRAM